jgi:hypothetical protein
MSEPLKRALLRIIEDWRENDLPDTGHKLLDRILSQIAEGDDVAIEAMVDAFFHSRGSVPEGMRAALAAGMRAIQGGSGVER